MLFQSFGPQGNLPLGCSWPYPVLLSQHLVSLQHKYTRKTELAFFFLNLSKCVCLQGYIIYQKHQIGHHKRMI